VAVGVEDLVLGLLEERGPQTGAELREASGADGFALWKTCTLSDRIQVQRVGRRYLRLDRKVEGYARLSPSILREFLTYTAVGASGDEAALGRRAEELAERIKEITEAKLRLAKRFMSDIGAQVGSTDDEEDRFAALLAGDIVMGMAHEAPRPERSTGRMVRGSDLDMVVLLDDDAPEELRQRLDDAIYQQKYRYLINPSLREEIDYTIKTLGRVREQVRFADIGDMVPCKILDEAVLLYGSGRLFRVAKSLLDPNDIPARLAAMEQEAVRLRDVAERHLLDRREESLSGDELYLFYTSDESEEFD
jgi:hypothetical protein